MAVAVTQTKVSTAANAFETDGIETLTFDAGAGAGSFVVVGFWLTALNRTVTSVVDDGSGGSNTYALLSEGGTDAHHESANASTELWFYGAQISNAMTAVTVTINSALATPARMAIWELDGQHATTPVEDVAVADNGAVADTSHACGPVTTAAAGNVLIGMIAGSNGVYQNEAGWTSIDSVTNGHMAYRTINAASTTWTPTTAGNENVAQVLIAMQPAAAGGTPVPVFVNQLRQQGIG